MSDAVLTRSIMKSIRPCVSGAPATAPLAYHFEGLHKARQKGSAKGWPESLNQTLTFIFLINSLV